MSLLQQKSSTCFHHREVGWGGKALQEKLMVSLFFFHVHGEREYERGHIANL